MSRLKKVSSHYDKAVTRLASLKSIDAKESLNGAISVPAYETQIGDFRKMVDEYNTQLSILDAAKNNMQAAEKELKNSSERMLSGVAYQFGKNSNEYEQAGGTRRIDRKRNSKKTGNGEAPAAPEHP